MRLTKYLLALAAVLVFCLPSLTAFSQTGLTELNAEAFSADQRGPVPFDHDQHTVDAELEDKCYVCHHTDGANPSPDDTSEGIPCADCHTVDGDNGNTPLRTAYHRQCIGCHDEVNAGPQACGECHIK